MNAACDLLARLDPAQAQAITPTPQQTDSAVAEGINAAHELESAARQQRRIDPRIRFARQKHEMGAREARAFSPDALRALLGQGLAVE